MLVGKKQYMLKYYKGACYYRVDCTTDKCWRLMLNGPQGPHWERLDRENAWIKTFSDDVMRDTFPEVPKLSMLVMFGAPLLYGEL